MLIHNAILVSGSFARHGWLRTAGGIIDRIGEGAVPPELISDDEKVIDAEGAFLMPGMIDMHVHFREPGLTHKASIASESRAALAGGVTTVADMPNTLPPTLTVDALRQKRMIADRDSAVRTLFFIGAGASNLDELRKCDPAEIAGIKLFMGSSTGNMAVGDLSATEAVFRLAAERGLLLMIHAEDDAIIAENIRKIRLERGLTETDDIPVALHSAIRSSEACAAATAKAIELALRYGTRLHIAHISTAEEVDMLRQLRSRGVTHITAEATPLHLTFCDEDYATRGTRIKVNPAVKSAADRRAIREAVTDGTITTIGTDHAPHLLAEKEGGALKATSGAPMIQFAVPLLMEILPPEIIVARMSEAPAALLQLDDRGSLAPGRLADVILVKKCEPYTVSDADVISPCGWTPLAGMTLNHRVVYSSSME